MLLILEIFQNQLELHDYSWIYMYKCIFLHNDIHCHSQWHNYIHGQSQRIHNDIHCHNQWLHNGVTVVANDYTTASEYTITYTFTANECTMN